MTAPTPQEVAEKLDAEATPGPWSCAPAVPGAKRHFYLAGNNDAHNRQVDIGTIQGGYHSCEANAALIAETRNALPALLSAIEAQAAEVARLKSDVEFLRSRRGDLCIERDRARDAINIALEAINPPDRGGISLATWNERLKSATTVLHEALKYDNRKARAALATDPRSELAKKGDA